MSEDAVKISVIVPAYNYGNYLGECLDSVLAQTYKNWECIIIDNGSTDNTSEVGEAYEKKDARFRYFLTAQNGVSFARNKAVELSTGEFILPLDADDKIAPTLLDKAQKILNEKKDIKVVYCDAELFGASSGKWTLPVFSLKDLLIENSIFCTALFRKTDFIKAGGYNLNMKEGFEDWDFWIRMLKDGSKVYKIPEVLFYYRIKAASRNSQLDHEKQLLLRRRIVENHKDLYAAFFPTADLIFDYHTASQELKSLKSSVNLKIGKLVLSPFRFFKTILKR
jgi:glycosyltransferase involved in cell wall biosynthesis